MKRDIKQSNAYSISRMDAYYTVMNSILFLCQKWNDYYTQIIVNVMLFLFR